jgi:hypothetical protein
VVGVFEGIGGALLKMVTGIWALVKEPLFWLAVGLLVIVAAVLIIAGVVTLGGLLAFLGKALLIIGVVFGVLAAGWALYQMIANPNLTWRERGRLFGEAITELVLAFAGTGILKRLGVFAQLGKLRRFVALVGGIGKAARLIKRVPDLDKLFILLSKAKDAEKLIILLDKVKDADRLILLLDKVKDADQLLRLLGKVSDTAQLLRLLSHAKIADAAVLERLLGNAKIADLGALERILGNPKLASVADLERALSNAKIADLATLDRLLSNTKLSNLAQLERVLANAKLADVAQLERLLNNPKLGHAAQLERLLGNAKIADAAQLEQLLDKVDRAGRMEAMLHMADNGAQLLDFLTRAGGVDAAASLERLMNLAGGQGQLGRLEKLLTAAAGAADKFNDMARWTVILAKRAAKPGVAEPADVAALGFARADMGHFLDHTWEFVDIAKRLNKDTTFWPRFTSPTAISNALGQALRNLNPTGVRPAMPLPDIALTTTAGGFTVQVGSRVPRGSPPGTPAEIGQFFPISQGGLDTIPRAVMKAIWDILRP